LEILNGRERHGERNKPQLDGFKPSSVGPAAAGGGCSRELLRQLSQFFGGGDDVGIGEVGDGFEDFVSLICTVLSARSKDSLTHEIEMHNLPRWLTNLRRRAR
jgi:hypothetical protein